MVPVVPLFSTPHLKWNTGSSLILKILKLQNSKYTIFEDLMEDWLSQINSLVNFYIVETNKTSKWSVMVSRSIKDHVVSWARNITLIA